MSGPKSIAAVAAMILLLSACSWPSWTASDDDGATKSPPSSVTSSEPETPAVMGLIRDPAGNPVRGAAVTLTSADTPGNPVPDIAVLTDEAGRYQWPAVLQAGRYQVEVKTQQGTASAMVTVRPSATASADMTLRQ